MHIYGIILAAGRGERMGSLTTLLPKALVYVGGKTLLEWNIERLSAAGCTEIIVATGWKGDMIQNAVSSIESSSNIQVVHVPDYEFGPLQTLVSAIDLVTETPVILNPVDLFISQSEVESIIAAHKSSESNDVTLAIDYGATTGSDVYVDSDGRMLSVGRETTEASKIGKSAMLLVFSQKFFRYCQKLHVRYDQRVSSVLNTLVHEGGLIRTHPVSSSWFDVDTFNDILKLNRFILGSGSIRESDSVFIHTGDTMEIGDNLELASGTSFGKGVQLKGPCLIQKNCMIGDNCIIGPDVSLGENTKIGEHTLIENSIIFGSSPMRLGYPVRNKIIYDNGLIGVE
ncbi:MAG: NDP-sugar synthase [Candidatus Thorarchaeota archaeon]